MYKIEVRRTAQKGLRDIPAEYVRLIAKDIDLLEQNPRPAIQKN